MRNFRAILVALVALSLTVLPVSAAEMRSSMAAGPFDMLDHGACCPHSGHCEKQTKKGCDDSGACLLKCTVLPATQAAATDLASPPKASPKRVTLIAALHAVLEHPPLPPPRV
jgi:hypothetical protein